MQNVLLLTEHTLAHESMGKPLISQHLESGRIRPSSSYVFIPKADPTALPRWVNDFQQLNEITIRDNHPLPRWHPQRGNFRLVNSRHNKFILPADDVQLTAVSNPFGLFEWLVMPLGLRNLQFTSSVLQLSCRTILVEYAISTWMISWSDSIKDHI